MTVKLRHYPAVAEQIEEDGESNPKILKAASQMDHPDFLTYIAGKMGSF